MSHHDHPDETIRYASQVGGFGERVAALLGAWQRQRNPD